MTNKWHTKRAKMDNGLYDYGACSVPQLLQGYDNEFYDANSNMYSDGLNPCSLNAEYLAYRESLYYNNNNNNGNDQDGPSSQQPVIWDFVVMNDQSRYPLSYQRRQRSSSALEETYVPLLQAAQAKVVLYSTYGYVSASTINDDDASGWKYAPSETEDDMPYFTSALYYGYQEYQEILEANGIETRLAPVGLAFLTLWEEDRELWRKLFFVDGLHASPLGTYLAGCVIYATIRGRLPPVSIRIEQVHKLWDRARRMNIGKSWYASFITDDEAAELLPMDLPTRSEAHILSNVCQRVALEGYQPSSFMSEDELGDNFFSDNDDHDNSQFVDDDNASNKYVSQDDALYDTGDDDHN
jgi:hypothetical protein